MGIVDGWVSGGGLLGEGYWERVSRLESDINGSIRKVHDCLCKIE